MSDWARFFWYHVFSRYTFAACRTPLFLKQLWLLLVGLLQQQQQKKKKKWQKWKGGDEGGGCVGCWVVRQAKDNSPCINNYSMPTPIGLAGSLSLTKSSYSFLDVCLAKMELDFLYLFWEGGGQGISSGWILCREFLGGGDDSCTMTKCN